MQIMVNILVILGFSTIVKKMKLPKMTTNRLLVLSILILTISACDPNRVYEKHRSDFSDNRWEQGQKVEFEPEITDDTSEYRIYFAMRHVYGFQFEKMNIQVETTSPSGQIAKKDYEVTVIGSDNEYLSECLESICDLEALLEEKIKYAEKGKYKYTVQHTLEVEYVPNVMEVGLIIERISP